MSRLLLLPLLMLFALSAETAPVAAQNLLQNPGCESGNRHATATTTMAAGWFDPAGGTTDNPACYASGLPIGVPTTPYGNALLGSGDAAMSAEQVVDVRGAAAAIDGGSESFTLSGHYHTLGTDAVTFTLEFLDADHLPVGSATTSGSLTSPGSWTPYTTSPTAPAGARFARVTLDCIDNDGSFCEGYFDNLALTTPSGVPPLDYTATDNLLDNPGCEVGDEGHALWYKPTSATPVDAFGCYAGGAGGIPSTPYGDAVHAGGTNNSATEQVVDLRGAATAIDGGSESFTLSGHYQTTGTDAVTFALQFLDADHLPVGSATTSGSLTSPGSWTPYTTSPTAPAGARFARVTLDCIDNDGSFCDGYFDNLALTAAGGVNAFLHGDDDNLLDNPGCEIGEYDIASWFDPAGGTTDYMRCYIEGVGGIPTAHQGDAVMGSSDVNANAIQEADVRAAVGAIDAGAKSFTLAGYYQTLGTDAVTFEMEFLDADRNDLGGGTNSGALMNPGSWMLYTTSATAPIGTRFVRVRLTCTDGDAGFCEGYFDTLSLTTPGGLPVELVRFEARVQEQAILLSWDTASETNNAGFEVQMGNDSSFDPQLPSVNLPAVDFSIPNPQWQPVAWVEGHGTTAEAHTYSHRVEGLLPGRHRFRLKQVDFDGAFAYSAEVEVVLGITGPYHLTDVYPNPFRSAARFALAVQQTQRVTIAVYDLLGRRVALLHDGEMEAGRPRKLTFDAVVPSGPYLVQVVGERFTVTRQITRVR